MLRDGPETKYKLVGVSRDLGNLIVVKVPPELAMKAEHPELYPEDSQMLKELWADFDKLCSGDSNYIVLSSDVNEDGSYTYDVELNTQNEEEK